MKTLPTSLPSALLISVTRLALTAIAAALPLASFAQATYPEKPIVFIVPQAAVLRGSSAERSHGAIPA